MQWTLQKKNKAIPFEIQDSRVKVCFADVANIREIENIRLLLLNKGLTMETYITFESEMDKLIKGLEGRVSSKIYDNNDTATNLVDTIIKTAISRRASDIHIEPMEKEVRIRYRIDGHLVTVTSIDKEKQANIIGRL